MPTETDRLAMKWDGEWHITIEVFRDLGLAFAAVLVLIYVLVVGWFRSFIMPLVIMAPIPLTLVGILPAHALMGAFFTATSMIGFIAGAGIIVRNSIILVDFIELRREQGMSLEHAVVDAGAVRFRPMLLTAAAVVVGASVILFDPIFQGLAISLMAGEVASTLLSRMAVPVLYYMVEKRKRPAPTSTRLRAALSGGTRMTHRTWFATDGGRFRSALARARILGQSPYWYLFTAFVGLNLLQSAFTNWCPDVAFLRKLGIETGGRSVIESHAWLGSDHRVSGCLRRADAVASAEARRSHVTEPKRAGSRCETADERSSSVSRATPAEKDCSQ